MLRPAFLFVAATILAASTASAQAPGSAPAAPPAAAAPAPAFPPGGAPGPNEPPPSLIAPPPPVIADLVKLPPYDLARGYLAAVNALPLAQQAGEGAGILTLGIDGVPYKVDTTNADQFIKLLQARVDIFSAAIKQRGSKVVDGNYTLAAGPGCTGEKFDPRFIFSPARAPGADFKMATTAMVISSGVETDLLVVLMPGRAAVGVVLTGTAVDDSIIFSNVLGLAYSIYGTIGGNTIALRFDPDEVENAIGPDAGTTADWKRLEGCVFTLTRRLA